MADDDTINMGEMMTQAFELGTFFSERGIKPADSLLVIAALHSAFMVEAQMEGKVATIPKYTEMYKEALELFVPYIEMVAGRGKKHDA